jgi:hypothetical protein
VKRLQNKGKKFSGAIVDIFCFTSIKFLLQIVDTSIKIDLKHYISVHFRFTGTIVGNVDPDQAGWAESKWRYLKVFTPFPSQ